MTSEDRLIADFHDTGMTVGPHPLRYHREDLRRKGVVTAIGVASFARWNAGAGCRVVIARQRPGPRKDLCFSAWKTKRGSRTRS